MSIHTLAPANPEATFEGLVADACRAPSVFNTQPWAWRIRSEGADLFADHSRRLRVADPKGRNLTISCGAALHHFEVAAGAAGWDPLVQRLPDPDAPALLARVRLRRAASSPSAGSDLEALRTRVTDRRRFTSWPVPPERLHRLAEVAAAWGCEALPLVDPSARLRTDLLMARAMYLQTGDPAVVAEQQRWTDRRDGLGVPSRTVPAEVSADESRRSRFGTGSLEESSRDIQGSDGLILMHGSQDTPETWLRCGEAMSALWLDAAQQGLSVVPLSQVAELAETRAALQADILPPHAYPFLLLRVGWQAIGRSDLAPTPRRDVGSVLLP